MLKTSSFIVEHSRAHSAKEERYYIIYAAALFLCGVLFLLIPLFYLHGLLILLEGWVLLAVFAMTILRPLFYTRGVADAVMEIFIGSLYAYLCFSLGSSVSSIEDFKLGLCAVMFLAGISRIIAYARMIVIVNIPLMPICGFAEILSSILIFADFPIEGYHMMYWFLGMTTILAGFESLTEAGKLRQLN